MRDYISPIIENKIPSFLKTEYKDFYSFIANYLKFLEEKDNPLEVIETLREKLDVNNDETDFTKEILRELGFDSDIKPLIPLKELVQYLRDFYLSRGSERSFDFLFKLIYGNGVKINYPREYLLIPSATEYSKKRFIFTTATTRDTNEYYRVVSGVSDYSLRIEGVSSKVVANIESITIQVERDVSYFKIQIDDTMEDFIPYEGVIIRKDEDNYLIESVIGGINFTIESPGMQYISGETFIVEGCKIPGEGKIFISPGGIQEIQVVSQGINYSIDDMILAQKTESGHSFSARVKSISSNGGITGIEILNSGYDYETVPQLYVKSKSGTSASISVKKTDIGRISKIEFIKNPADPIDLNSIQVTFISSGVNAVLRPQIISSFYDKSIFKNQNGVLGVNGILIDSYYYQQFSYEVKSSVSRNIYDPLVNKWVHPAGFVRFASFTHTFTDNLWENDIEETLKIGFPYKLKSSSDEILFNSMSRYFEFFGYIDFSDELDLYTDEEKSSNLFSMSDSLEVILNRKYVFNDSEVLISNLTNIDTLKTSDRLHIKAESFPETILSLTSDRIMQQSLESHT